MKRRTAPPTHVLTGFSMGMDERFGGPRTLETDWTTSSRDWYSDGTLGAMFRSVHTMMDGSILSTTIEGTTSSVSEER